MNHLRPVSSPRNPTFHVLGFLAHGTITQEVRSNIQDGQFYLIKEIAPNGYEHQEEFSGTQIREHYPQIFDNWKHAFIVMKKGSQDIVFIYEGPIPDIVSHILDSSTTIH